MQYQDELESGRKTVKAGWTVAEQVKINLKIIKQNPLWHHVEIYILTLNKSGGALPSEGDEEDGFRARNTEEGSSQSQCES